MDINFGFIGNECMDMKCMDMKRMDMKCVDMVWTNNAQIWDAIKNYKELLVSKATP